MPRDVICVSYDLGAGGEEVARRVADRLGFAYLNEEIVVDAARRGGIDRERVADEERRKGMFEGLLDYLSNTSSLAPGAPTAPPDEISAEAVQALLRGAIDAVAERGSVVIAAHAASHALADQPRALRVLVTATPDARAARVAAEQQLEAREATKRVSRSDAARADYLRRFYGIARELPTQYDVVVNTGTLSHDEAAEVVVRAAAGDVR